MAFFTITQGIVIREHLPFFHPLPIFKLCIQLPESTAVLFPLSDRWTECDDRALLLIRGLLFFNERTVSYNYSSIIITPSTPSGASRGRADGKSEVGFSARHLPPEEEERHFAQEVGTNDSQGANPRSPPQSRLWINTGKKLAGN